MPFWSTQKIRQALASSTPLIIDAQPARVTSACYEMALGAESFVTSGPGTKETKKKGEQFSIPPGQFGLLLTEESLAIPNNVLAFISIKASKKISGLVNVSGFHVDPGFHGRLKFSVYNAGAIPIVLQVGEPLFPIWFADLDDVDASPYGGKHQSQTEISSSDTTLLQGDVASPAALKKVVDDFRLDIEKQMLELRSHFDNTKTWIHVTMGVILLVLGGILARLLK